MHNALAGLKTPEVFFYFLFYKADWSPLNVFDPVTDDFNSDTARDATDMENGRSRLQQAQEEVEEVKVIMLDNLNKADERAGKLEDLEDRADDLLERSKTFEKTAHQVKQKKKWENKKMKLVFIGVGVVAGLIIVGLIIYAIVNSTGEQ